MREPQIDVTALVVQLRRVNEHYYASGLEDAVSRLNQADDRQLSTADVQHFNRAVAELRRGNTSERKIAVQLKEFVDAHKPA